MEWFEPIKRVIQRLTRSLSFVGMFLLVPMMLLTFVDVVARKLWSVTIPGAMEVSSYMLAVFVLLGIGYTQQVKGHVRVTMFVSRISQRLASAIEVFTILLSLFIIGILAWQGWVVAWEESAVSDMLRVPEWPFRLLVSVAGACLWLELVVDLVASLSKLARR